MSNKIRKIILLLVIITFLILCLKVRVSPKINIYGKVYPSEEVIVQQIQNDVIKVKYNNVLEGNLGNEKIFNAERGDVISIKINSSINNGSQIYIGDTLCTIISNETKRSIEEIAGELSSAQELLKIYESGEKESIVKEAEARLAQATTNLINQEKVNSRNLELYKDSLISNEEFEYQNTLYETLKADVIIAEAQLEAVLDGAKKEQINLQLNIISSLEKQLQVVRERQKEGFIISPLTGSVSFPTFNDTILMVKSVSTPVLFSTIEFKYFNDLKIGQEIKLSSINNRILTGRISYISNDVLNVNGKSIVYIIAEIDETNDLVNGQLINGKLKLGSISLKRLILTSLN